MIASPSDLKISPEEKPSSICDDVQTYWDLSASFLPPVPVLMIHTSELRIHDVKNNVLFFVCSFVPVGVGGF